MLGKSFLSTAFLALGALAQDSSDMSLTDLIASSDQLSSLAAILNLYPDVAAQVTAATNVTLFAPNNAAIQALNSSGALEAATMMDGAVEALLSYHVVVGQVPSDAITETPSFAATTLENSAYSNVTGGQVVEAAVDGEDVVITSGLKAPSTVTEADLMYNHGIVHIIDTVLTIPMNVSSTALAANLTALASALETAELLTTVDGLSDVTIFAPSNDAFAAIGSAVGELSMGDLAGILQYHVVEGTVGYSSSLEDGQELDTLGGGSVTISVEDDGSVFVNGAQVVNPDVLVAGGVIHVIDSVLNPDNATATPDPESDTPAVQFEGASSAPLGALTSGSPPLSTTISALVATSASAAGGSGTTGGGGAMETGGGGGGGGGGESSSESEGAAAMATGMVGAAALFGGAALVANW